MFLAMKHTPDIIPEVEQYCVSAGIAPSTLALRAIGNARFFERLNRRREHEAKAERRIREYMDANPPKTETDAA
jgi:hypothetical protein